MTLPTVAIAAISVSGFLIVCIALLKAIEFRPPAEVSLSPLTGSDDQAPRRGASSPPLRVVTWNLGFASLDARMDYFTDGGRRSRGFGREQTEANLATIVATLRDIDADVMFLQEVDRPSARSHYVDQVAALAEAFPDHLVYFAANLVSPYIPVPVRRPIGPVHSGMMTLLRASLPVVREARRVALPGMYSFPKRVFHVKRCFIETSVRWGNKDVALINLHHSAYDTGGIFRVAQIEAVIRRMRDVEASGAVAISGGDWNAIFPGVAFDRFAPWTTEPRNLEWLQRIPTHLTPESWRWLCDATVPTVRTNNRPYVPGESYRTIIDGFLATAGIGTTKTRGIDTAFAPSDHQPVVLDVW